MHILSKYIDRLTKEWLNHGKIIIAVDFDDTISPWSLNSQEDCDKVLDILKMVQDRAYIVIFTACKPDRFEEIKKYCILKNLNIESINVNPFNLPYGNDGKIYANLFIDDRGGLNESLQILQGSYYNLLGKEHGKDLSEITQF